MKHYNTIKLTSGWPNEFGLGVTGAFLTALHDNNTEYKARFFFGSVTILFWKVSFSLQLSRWKLAK